MKQFVLKETKEKLLFLWSSLKFRCHVLHYCVRYHFTRKLNCFRTRAAYGGWGGGLAPAHVACRPTSMWTRPGAREPDPQPWVNTSTALGAALGEWKAAVGNPDSKSGLEPRRRPEVIEHHSGSFCSQAVAKRIAS